jgi:ornithine carbamoyltransferase
VLIFEETSTDTRAVFEVAAHELRERSSRARKEAALLHDQLTELTLV